MGLKLCKIMLSSALVSALLTVSSAIPTLAANGDIGNKTNHYVAAEATRLISAATGEPELLEHETPVPETSALTSGITITGQKVGTGTKDTPAVGLLNSAITVSLNVGLNPACPSVTYLVSSSDNITAKDSNEVILEATALRSPVIIGNDIFKAAYTVPVDASGNVKASFTASAISRSLFNVVIRTPFSNNGQPVQSSVGSVEWGAPGTLVLSPIYPPGDPDCLNFSTPDSVTRGLVPVSATLLPADGSSSTAVSGQYIKFTMTAIGQSTPSVNAYFTDSSGKLFVSSTPVYRSVYRSSTIRSITYVAITDDNGQTLVYINSDLSTNQSGTTDLDVFMTVSVQAQLLYPAQPVFSDASSATSYFHWNPMAQSDLIDIPTKVNVAPDKVWTIKFSSSLDPTLTKQTLSDYINVTDSSGNLVNITAELGNDSQFVLVNPPVKGYNLASKYYLYIKGGLKLQTGQPLQTAIRMQFVISPSN
ncbi:MAG: hypothetical protein P4L49_03170 [Desulfosporosinus sp.]|nr:hypothetical protein [Desulfosporosinus sp.]